MVRDSNDPATRKRKWQVPTQVAMNVLVKAGNVLSSLETVSSALQPALREACLEHTSVRGVARVAIAIAMTGHLRPTVSSIEFRPVLPNACESGLSFFNG